MSSSPRKPWKHLRFRFPTTKDTKGPARQSRNQMKGWVNHEGHEAHEGYDLGGFETRL